MKILHLQLLPILTGAQNFSLHLLEGLDPGSYEIHIAAAGEGDLGKATRERGWTYHALKYQSREIGLKDIPALLELIRLIKRERFEIVHTNSSKPGMLGRLTARICKVPLIVHTSHGLPFHPGHPRYIKSVYRLMEKISHSFGDVSVFVNNSDRVYSVAQGLIPGDKAMTVYNAIPVRLQARLEAIRKQRAIPQERQIVIGSTMRFSGQKNAVQLVISACKVCQRSDKLRFIFVGDGEHYELCRQMVKSLDLNERIILPGWDSDVSAWLSVFDAFILYSRWEAQPFSIIEAMQAGLPVIGSEISSIGELVTDETGYLVPLSEPERLENLLVGLGEDFSEAFEKGKRGAGVISGLCSYPGMVEAYDKIYRGVRHE